MSEKLYNGLIIPDQWPPSLNFNGPSEILPANYVQNKPEICPIDVGRQLFVDNFLIHETSMTKTFHQAIKSEHNPVLSPKTNIELDNGECPVAAPFNDGVWWDTKDRMFKMWYHSGWMKGTCLATSEDGINWIRPTLDVVPGTNLVLVNRDGYRRDGCCVWLDHTTHNPEERFKMFQFFRYANNGEIGEIYSSADGIHWGDPTPTGVLGDNSTFFYNPFIKKWVYSIRTPKSHSSKLDPNTRHIRTRSYREHENFFEGSQWDVEDMSMWAWSDYLDLPDPYIGDEPQLYDVNANAYESLMLGLFAIYQGPHNEIAERNGIPKTNDLTVAFSRDGFHWDRESRQPFIASERKDGSWDKAYIHAAGGTCLVVGDELYFYYGAWSGISPNLHRSMIGSHRRANAMYAGGSTGLATLRRDGFASMDSGNTPRVLTTKLVTFSGQHLFVNCDASLGSLKIEILDENGEVLQPFTADKCDVVNIDSTKKQITWSETDNLSAIRETKVRFKFYTTNTKLYSFWVSNTPKGESGGYLSAGGPEFEGIIDCPSEDTFFT